jgi:hypothetical protein
MMPDQERGVLVQVLIVCHDAIVDVGGCGGGTMSAGHEPNPFRVRGLCLLGSHGPISCCLPGGVLVHGLGMWAAL